MAKENIFLGKSGEDIAVNLLKEHGYKILERNYKLRLGEIDIIAKDKDTIAFIEVKTRYSDKFGLPQEAVSRNKQRQISKAALSYLKENNFLDIPARFDVVAISYSEGSPKSEIIKNAFDLDPKFSY